MASLSDPQRNALTRAQLHHWAAEVRSYWREACTPSDFAKVMRVRLSQSRAGPLVCPKPIVVRVNLRTMGSGIWLRSHTTDISVRKELIVGGGYEPLVGDADTTVVVDLGANTGLSARWLATRFPHARLVCVEPDPGNAELLRRNVAALDALVVRACVGGHARTVALDDHNGEWGYRMVDSPAGDVPVVTMPMLLEQAGIDRIDVLKCDIEGAEAELFATCAPWIACVRRMIVETHLDVISTADFLRLLPAATEVVHSDENPHLGFDVLTLRLPQDAGSPPPAFHGTSA